MAYPAQLGKAAMFMMGFIMLMPHRIALSCSPYLVKRFHLPMPTVGLFIYKIHSPMELSSLCGTFLANVLTWVNDSTINTMYLKRYCSIIFMWLMFLCSVLTYYLFVSGDEFGYLQYFYWNMIFFTLIYGFMSSFCFGVNFNTSMAGAGLPTSGGFTFVLHNTYKWFYKKYHWAEYDYNLMILQLSTTMGFLLFTSILWTVDQCWNILEPEYKSFLIQGIFSAANNEGVAKPGGVSYTWNNEAGSTSNSGNNLNTVTAAADADKKNSILVEKLNDTSNGVVKKFETVWNSLKSQPTTLWTDPQFNVPVWILTVVGGVLGLLLFMGLITTTLINKNGLFIIIGISISVLTLISVLTGLLPANYHDKEKLRGISLEYHNFTEIYTSYTNDNTNTNAVADGTGKKINASKVTAGNHFQTADNVNAPQIRILGDPNISTQTEGIAKANIIAVIGIVSIIVIFACVLLFSIIIFYRDKNSLAAPLFLFTFIATTAALTFGGIAISSAIAVFHLYSQNESKKAATPAANTCSCILLPSFGVISILGIILSLKYSYTNWPIIAFILYGAIAGGAAISANDSIKKLFAGDPKAGHDWSPIGMLAYSMGVVYFFYPSISPYQLVNDEELGNDIELWALLISSIPTLLIALLDIEWDGTNKIGPGGKWYQDAGPPKRDDNHAWWHLTHAAFVPYYICVFSFFLYYTSQRVRLADFLKVIP